MNTYRPRIMPSANLYLQFKWDLIDYETHMFNIRHAKTTIDKSKPRIVPHLFQKYKPLQLGLDRKSSIQIENRALMERIATIHRKGSWVDHKNYHQIKNQNTIARQKKMVELQYENKVMMERLNDVHSAYNRKQLEDGFQMQKKFGALLLRYPNNWNQILHKLTKERKKIREEFVYPRAGYKPKKSDGKGKVTKSSASDSPRSTKSSMKSDSEGSTSSKKKTVQLEKTVQFEKDTPGGKKSIK